MNTSASSVKVQTAFRFNPDLIERLKARAKRENRSLNNYVEKVLMDIVYVDSEIHRSIQKGPEEIPESAQAH